MYDTYTSSLILEQDCKSKALRSLGVLTRKIVPNLCTTTVAHHTINCLISIILFISRLLYISRHCVHFL